MTEEKPKKFGLGDLFEGLNSLIDLVTKLQDHDETVKSGEFKTESGVSGVYGVRIKTAAGGSPELDQFGNIGRGRKAGVIDDEREPLVDIFEENDTITVVAEIPGSTEESIEVSLEGANLRLSASARDRKYRKELTLPCETKGEPVKRSYINGIFSLVLARLPQPDPVTPGVNA